MGYNGTGSSPAYFCGKLIFNGAFFALGFSTNFAVNRFSVSSKLAQKVKRAFYKELETDTEIANFTKAIEGNSLDARNNRTTFLEKTESFTASEKKELANNPPRLNHLAKNSRKIGKFIPGDIRQLLTNKLGHITGIEFKLSGGKYEFTGVHSKLALDRAGPGNARIEITTPRNSSGVYEAKVYAKGPDGQEVLKTGNHGISTLFPDDWDEARILEEVHHAVENNRGKVPKGPDVADNQYYGFSKDGKVKIEFYYNEATKAITSFFPSIKAY